MPLTTTTFPDVLCDFHRYNDDYHDMIQPSVVKALLGYAHQ